MSVGTLVYIYLTINVIYPMGRCNTMVFKWLTNFIEGLREGAKHAKEHARISKKLAQLDADYLEVIDTYEATFQRLSKRRTQREVRSDAEPEFVMIGGEKNYSPEQLIKMARDINGGN